MKIKTDWEKYLHTIRKREIDLIFKAVPPKSFENALEIGAGDGFQSDILLNSVKNLCCTEYNRSRLKKVGTKDVTYTYCDAEYIDRYFESKTFDLLFSSNLLEHVGRRDKVLRNAKKLLRDEGVLICVVPNTFLKLCWLWLFYPNQAVELMEVVVKPGGVKKILKKISNNVFNYQSRCSISEEKKNINNLKSQKKQNPQGILLPAVHGDYGSHLEEFLAYRKKAWTQLLENHGFYVAKVLKMPVASGYGFGLNWFRYILEEIGLSSSFAIIAFKKGFASRFQGYWSR